AFVLAFVAGPTLSAWFGVPGLFWLTAGFALLGMLIIAQLHAPAPTPARALLPLREVLPMVAPQAAGIFALHAIMTATFLAVPGLLTDTLQIPAARHGWVYLPVMFASLLLLIPLVLLQERRPGASALHVAVAALAAGQAGLWLAPSTAVFLVALAVFFGGFNFVEARFPAQVS